MKKFLVACATLVMCLSGQSLSSKVNAESELELESNEELGLERHRHCPRHIYTHHYCKHHRHHHCCR